MPTKQLFLFVASLLLSVSAFSQSKLNAVVLDDASNEPLIGAAVMVKGTTNGALSDLDGKVEITNIPNGTQTIVARYTGYKTQELELIFPLKEASITIRMAVDESLLDEVVIEATRANKSIANIPTRTEALTEEIGEAATMEPGRVSHLLTHSTGIQVQTTAATSNGAVVRIQGMQGRYTQLLRDGFPLYGGFSGSLDIMQIPPLDLRQVEFIKGSASTLYGGGAIGGLVNLLSKKPNKDETMLHLNASHIGARDLNAFVSRKLGKRWGFTNLASYHLQNPYDADSDGYADLPEVAKFNFNPRFFFYPDKKTELYFGATVTNESRNGGDMLLINNVEPTRNHYFYDRQRTQRYTSQAMARRDFTKEHSLTLRNSISLFDRSIQIRQNAQGDRVNFSGEQLNSFSEANYMLQKEKHTLNLGLNLYTDRFTEQRLDTNQLRHQEYLTVGAYVNHLWDPSEKFAVESGLRTDYANGRSLVSENDGEFFVLPRVSALYKLNKNFAFRLGGGLGYRMPTIFNEEAEPFGYAGIRPIDFANVDAERSYGTNFDVKYTTQFGRENMLLSLNHMFFYNVIDNPILLLNQPDGSMVFDNFGEATVSQGFETQAKLTVGKFTAFVGYTFTDAFLQGTDADFELVLTPRHSIKGDILFVEEKKWMIGIDYEYKSSQLLSTGLRTRDLFTTGIVVWRTWNDFTIFLNAENFTDVRQTRYQSIVGGPYNTPQYTEIWAPLDGFFFNAGCMLKL